MTWSDETTIIRKNNWIRDQVIPWNERMAFKLIHTKMSQIYIRVSLSLRDSIWFFILLPWRRPSIKDVGNLEGERSKFLEICRRIEVKKCRNGGGRGVKKSKKSPTSFICRWSQANKLFAFSKICFELKFPVPISLFFDTKIHFFRQF